MALNLLDANDTAGKYPPSFYAAGIGLQDPMATAKGEIRSDVCIVGGGYTGLSAALHLRKRGFSVTLLEAQRIGFGASGRNGGQVGTGQRVDQDALEAMVGKGHARRLWDISIQSVTLVRKLCTELGVAFNPGVLHVDHRRRYVADTRAYVDLLKQEYGHDHVRFVDQSECRELVASKAYFGGALDMYSGHIHPLKFARALGEAAMKAGADIFELSRVCAIRKGKNVIVETEEAKVVADHVILACNGYLGGLMPEVAARVMPINNFIAATAPMDPDEQESVIKNNVAVADSKFVVNYFRFSEDHRLLFGGTESYGYRFPKDIARSVRRPLGEIFPQLAKAKIDYAWGGTLGITMNRMPHFARVSDNILSLSGYSGHGVAMATLGGQIAAEAIAGQAERFDALANVPTPRFPGGASLRSPLLVLAMIWYSLRDRL